MTIALMVPQHLILKENLPGRQRSIKDIGWLAEVFNAKQPLTNKTCKLLKEKEKKADHAGASLPDRTAVRCSRLTANTNARVWPRRAVPTNLA